MDSGQQNLFIEVNYDQLNEKYKTEFLNTTEDEASTKKETSNQEFGLLNKYSELAIYDKDVDKINIEWEKSTDNNNNQSMPPEFKIKNINFLKKQSTQSTFTTGQSEKTTPPEYTYAIKNLAKDKDQNEYNLKMASPVAGQSGGTAKKTRIRRKKTKIVKRAKTLRGKRHNNLRV
jgi:hypothetical protein